MNLAQIVAVLLLPPLPVYAEEGASRNFWIAVALTLLGYIPGIIFAFYVLSRTRPMPDES